MVADFVTNVQANIKTAELGGGGGANCGGGRECGGGEG